MKKFKRRIITAAAPFFLSHRKFRLLARAKFPTVCKKAAAYEPHRVIKITRVNAVRTLFLFCLIFLAGCSQSQTFKSGDGLITITAAKEFKQVDDARFNICLESKDKIITGIKEAPGPSFPAASSLRDYTLLVKSGRESSEISLYDKGGVVFDYFDYEFSTDGKAFKYLAVTKKSDTSFYLFNFGCEKKNFDKFEKQFMDWAKTIEVG